MKAKIFLTIIFLITPVISGAQNTSDQDSSILSSLPDIEIDSTDNYNNSTGQSTSSQSTLTWIIILGLVFTGVVLYSFEIDPKWVVLLIGVAAAVFVLSRFGLMPV